MPRRWRAGWTARTWMYQIPAGSAVLCGYEQGAIIEVLPGAVYGGEAVPGPAGVVGLAREGVADAAVELPDGGEVGDMGGADSDRHYNAPFA